MFYAVSPYPQVAIKGLPETENAFWYVRCFETVAARKKWMSLQNKEANKGYEVADPKHKAVRKLKAGGLPPRVGRRLVSIQTEDTKRFFEGRAGRPPV